MVGDKWDIDYHNGRLFGRDSSPFWADMPIEKIAHASRDCVSHDLKRAARLPVNHTRRRVQRPTRNRSSSTDLTSPR